MGKKKMKVNAKPVTPVTQKASTEPLKKKLEIVSSASLNEKKSMPLTEPVTPSRPKVLCSPKAWAQMWHAIDVADKMGTEITWFTPVLVDGDVLRIPEIFIPDQEVTVATTECPNLSKIVFECYQAGYDICDLRGWFHLHPNGMSVNPSGTDEDQAEEYLQEWDSLLRGIFNKDGAMKLDYYDKVSGYLHSNIDISVDWSDMCDTDSLNTLIDERVSKKVYTYAGNNYGINNYGSRNYANGGWGNQKKNGSSVGGQQSFTEHLVGEAEDDKPVDNLAIRKFIADVNGETALVDVEELHMFGQQAMLLHPDGVEFGFDIVSAIDEEMLTIEQVMDFLENKSDVEMNDPSFRFMFPCLMKDEELAEEEDSEAAEQENKNAAH